MTGDPDNDIYVIFSTTIFSAEVRQPGYSKMRGGVQVEGKVTLVYLYHLRSALYWKLINFYMFNCHQLVQQNCFTEQG